jgi:DNA modification methylase
MALEGALDEVGWVADVVVNRTTGRLVDGHLRVERAIARGEQTVPVTFVELTVVEERLVLATLDPLGAMAEADIGRLTELLAAVQPSDEALRVMLADLAAANRVRAPWNADPEAIPELPEPAALYVEPGQTWRLGRHRVRCCDARSSADLATLLAGTSVSLLWTDPPYGIGYQAKISRAEARRTHRRGDGAVIANDDLAAGELRSLLETAFRNAVTVMAPGAPFYVAAPEGVSASGDVHVVFRQALAAAGLPIHQTLVWIKDRFVLGRADYHWRHEPLLYGWKPGARHFFTADRSQDTVIEIARPARSPEHPSAKPVALVERCLANSSRPGDVVLDLFGGAGSTLVAAERLGRTAYLLELDPRYVQVILERWRALTGEEAVLDG